MTDRRRRAPPCALLAAALAAGCASTPEISASMTDPLCQSGEVVISTAFPAGGQLDCTVSPEGEVILQVLHEKAPEEGINPSPWYALDAYAVTGAHLEITFDYGAFRHRYAPRIDPPGPDGWRDLPDASFAVAEDRHSLHLSLDLAPGVSRIAGQPIITPDDIHAHLALLEGVHGLAPVTYGQSVQGRPLTAYRAGPADASRVVVLLSGQHPPELTGVQAYLAVVDGLMASVAPIFWADTQVILAPSINPDGVVHGHWRHNVNGVDLNRDWFDLTQPETAALTRLLEAEIAGRPVMAFLDFHSTWSNRVYSPPLDSTEADMTLLARLKDGLDAAMSPAPEWRFAHNPGRGTSKAWGLDRLHVAAATVELGDDATPDEIAAVARAVVSALTTP